MKLNSSIAWVALFGGVALFFTPPPAGIDPVVMRAAGIVTLTVGLFATAAIPEFLSALIFFFLCVIVALAPPNVVFSGFFSGAVWLVLGGLIIGVGIEVSGLGARIAGKLERLFGDTYVRVIWGTVLLMSLLAFLMPSAVGRVAIMLPVVLALADRLGFETGSNGRAGLILAVGLGTLILPFSILPANVPNVVLAGAAEAAYNIRFSYTEWMLLHFPVSAIIGLVVLPVSIILIFPDKVAERPSDTVDDHQPWSFNEKKMLILLICTLLLWVTDNRHGASPAWVSLGAGIVCALPVVGVLPAPQVMQKMNFGPLIFLAAVVGMGAVVIDTGLGNFLAQQLTSQINLASDSGLEKFASVIGIGWVLQLVATLAGQPAIMTAISEPIAAATGWSLTNVLMMQVPAWALLIFPYQAPPLVATRAISGLAISQFLKLMLPFALVSALISVPLQYLWWQFLGFLPA
ncbi:MAG: sodium:sulfate symporter [Rhodospirillaceae bacterium]|nr:sodium:sulfate symporter [Rhodospirillaceae bacterium]